MVYQVRAIDEEGNVKLRVYANRNRALQRAAVMNKFCEAMSIRALYYVKAVVGFHV